MPRGKVSEAFLVMSQRLVELSDVTGVLVVVRGKMAPQQAPAALEVGEQIILDDPIYLTGPLLDIVAVPGFLGPAPAAVDQLRVLDEVREPEPAVEQSLRLADSLLEILQAGHRVSGADDPPGPVEGRRVSPDRIRVTQLERPLDATLRLGLGVRADRDAVPVGLVQA